jgi:prepilin-type N-terminal cleavage/methylation domain-containing protein
MRGDNFHFVRLRRRGFTLIELLVVIGIIVLIAAAAVPLFRFITASRSVDNANNMVDSMVGRGRAQALVEYRNAGIFFFLDPVTDRTTMALVHQAGDSFRDPDFYAYKGWTDGSDQIADGQGSYPAGSVGTTSGNVTYYDVNEPANGPSYAMALIQGTAPIESSLNQQEWFYQSETNPKSTNGAFQKFTNIRFQCSLQHSAQGNSNDPPSSQGPKYWNGLPPTDLDIVAGTDVQLLPPGVGLQVINDTKGNANTDRYLRTGVILFDNEGKFQSVPWSMNAVSTLAKLIDPGTGAPTTPSGIPPAGGLPAGSNLTADVNGNKLFSGFGVVLYDRATFLSLGYTEGDYLYKNAALPGGSYFPFLSVPPNMTSGGPEDKEETWLDNNSLPLVVNRFNGALTKGE